MNLDDQTRYRELDAHGMRTHIDGLPGQLESAWKLGADLPLPDVSRRLARIVIAGTGTGGIAGDLIAALVADSCNVPVAVSRAYDLPAYADGQSTLVILLDHTGDDEVTYSALELADARGTKFMALTSGGPLVSYAERSGALLWRYGHDGPARTALAYQFGLLLALFSRLGLVRDLNSDVSEAIAAMRAEVAALAVETPALSNPAKRLAGQMIGRVPLIYGAGIMSPVARRWRMQIAENAKAFAVCDELPEMNYNTLSGMWMLPEGVRPAVVCLAAPALDHPRVKARQEHTRQMFMIEGIVPDTYLARGESPLAQMMTAIQFGDYVSYYLAIALGVDPTPTPALDELKAKLMATR